MNTISADQVKELRDMTGAGIMDSKRALESAEGNMEKAVAALMESGLAKASKKTGRSALQGIVEAYIHTGGRVGSLVELNCETDFVARTPEFKSLARDLAMQIAAMSPKYIDRESIPDERGVSEDEVLWEQVYIRDGSMKVGDLVNQMIAKVGENIKIGRMQRFALGE